MPIDFACLIKIAYAWYKINSDDIFANSSGQDTLERSDGKLKQKLTKNSATICNMACDCL